MATDEDHAPAMDQNTSHGYPCNYSPVTVCMEDSLGTIFLGVLSALLLIGWMRAESHYRKLVTRLEMTDGNRSSNA
jgi:hypothetical protein